ncbi:hypothetical protein Q5752_001875 [Cryptotrichosporon argae]
MLHTLSAPLHPSKSRRAVSMPALSLTLSTDAGPGPSSASAAVAFPFLPPPSTSASRRKSLLSRSALARSRLALPLGLAALCALAVLVLLAGPPPHPAAQGTDNASRLRWYRRGLRFSAHGYGRGAGSGDSQGPRWGTGEGVGHAEGFEREITGATYARRPTASAENGVHVLAADEAELIAEDDLFWESYKEAPAPSAEEAAAEHELQQRRKDVLERDRAHALQALVYWMAEGGIFPPGADVPSKAALRKMGTRAFERMLEDAAGDAIFEAGWADFAQTRYREVVFSKTYCPYSKNAKAILEEYRLTPTPFIIELDQRSDTAQIQTLLQHLTGRRTVPNILLDFASVGGSDEIELLHSEGGLGRAFEEMGVMPRRGRRPARRV